MKTIDVDTILNKQFAFINDQTASDGIIKNVSVKTAILDFPNKQKYRLLRTTNIEYGSDAYKKAKGYLPRFYITGTFNIDWSNGFPIKEDNIETPSGLMSIDIDAKENPNIDLMELRKTLFQLPYVFSCLKSISGKGLYCLIPIEDTYSTTEYYEYIKHLWEQKFGIICDGNSKSILRCRICSYDEDAINWIKTGDVQVWNLKRKITEEPKVVEKEIFYPKYEQKHDGIDWDFITNKAMELVINNGYKIESYGAWYYLGCELKNFPNGEQMFIEASKNNPKYNDSLTVILNKFSCCEPCGLNDELRKKWIGMANNRFGRKWFLKYIQNDKQPTLF